MADIRHKFIPDAELHDPNGFGTASNKTVLTKDENGVSRYVAATVLEKALNFVDGNAAPPTEVLGAIYVLIDEGNGAVDSGWDGASYDDWVRFNGTTWVSYTPSEGVFCYNATDNTLYLFTTSWDRYGVGSNMANTNLTLDANRTHDLAGYNLTFSGGTTIHEGADTLSSSSHTKFYDGDTTPNLLWDWKNDGSLVGYKSKIQLIAQNNTSGSLVDYVLRLRTVGNGDNLALFANDGFFALGSSNTMAGTSVYSTQFIVGPSNTINRTSGGNSFIVGRGNNLTGNGSNHVIVGTSNTQTGTGVDTLVGSFITAGGTAGATNLFGYSIDGNTYDNINAVGSWVDFNGGNFANLFGIGVASNATGASVIGHGSESNVSVNKLVNSTARSLALGWNTTTPQHLFFQTGAYIGGNSAISTENISLQGSVMVADSGDSVGFYGTTPTAQATTGIAAATFTANTSGIADDTATFDGYTIGQVVKSLRNLGILA